MSSAPLRISSIVLASLLLAVSAGAVNYVANGYFDTSLADWSTVSAEPFWLGQDWQGDPNSGSARVPDQLAQPSNNVYLMQCIALGGATEPRRRRPWNSRWNRPRVGDQLRSPSQVRNDR